MENLALLEKLKFNKIIIIIKVLFGSQAMICSFFAYL